MSILTAGDDYPLEITTFSVVLLFKKIWTPYKKSFHAIKKNPCKLHRGKKNVFVLQNTYLWMLEKTVKSVSNLDRTLMFLEELFDVKHDEVFNYNIMSINKKWMSNNFI